MTPDDIKVAGETLFRAEVERRQIGLLSLAYPDMNMGDAYAVQEAFVEKKRAAGGKVIGWKIGLTSKAMQNALNIDIPDSGVLFEDMVFANGGTIPKSRFIQPRVEAEIAFVMKKDLKGPGLTMEDVLAATDHILPSLEILDTRIERADSVTGKTRSVLDTIADNAANAGIVTSGQAIDPEAIDMRWLGAIVSRNGEVEETGLGAGVLNHPALGIVWLTDRLAKYGHGLKAGEIILSGSFIRPLEAPPGSEISADFGSFGSVSCKFL